MPAKPAYSVIPVGWQLSKNTTAAHGDTFAVLAGGAVLGGFAALHYWFPKLTGRLLGEGLGKAALAAILAGTDVYVLATFLAGVKGQPVDVYKFFEGNGLDGFNLVASIAAFVLAIGVLLQLANVAHSLGTRRARGARSVGRGHARMVLPLASAGAQLRRRPGRSQRRAPRRHPSCDPRADRAFPSGGAPVA